MPIAQQYPQLQCVVEDRPAVVEKANVVCREKPDICTLTLNNEQYWKENLPSASVQIVPQDFFAEQSIKQPAVFTLFHVIHDWGRTASVNILRRLRDAAGSDTKLIIGDQVRCFLKLCLGVLVHPLPYLDRSLCLSGRHAARHQGHQRRRQPIAPPPTASSARSSRNGMCY